MEEQKTFGYMFQCSKLIIFTVSYIKLRGNRKPYFSTSCDELIRNKRDINRGGQAQEALLPPFKEAYDFYKKWDVKHLAELTDEEIEEVLKDIEVLKQKYNYIELPEGRENFSFYAKVELSKQPLKSKKSVKTELETLTESRDKVAEHLSEFVYNLTKADFDKYGKTAWSGNEPTTMGGEKTYQVFRNGKSDFTPEEVEQAILKEYPELEVKGYAEGNPYMIFFRKKAKVMESKLTESEDKLIWTSDTDIEGMYNDLIETGELDPEETSLKDFINSDEFSDLYNQAAEEDYEMKVEVFEEDIEPKIISQCNEDILVLAGTVGRWNGKSTGGKIMRTDNEDLLDVLSSSEGYDIEIFVDNSNKVYANLHHHDGTHTMYFYTLPAEKEKQIELAKACGYTPEDYEDDSEDYMLDDFLTDIFQDYIDEMRLITNVDKLVPIQGNKLIESKMVEDLPKDDKDIEPETYEAEKEANKTIQMLQKWKKAYAEKTGKKTETIEEEIPIVNPENSIYADSFYEVDLWCGVGPVMSQFKVFANNEEDALNIVVAYAEENAPNLLIDTDKVDSENGEDEDLIYVDATMEGASRPYYVYNNVNIKTLVEESVLTEAEEDEEEPKEVIDYLQDRIGQIITVGQLNNILQSIFGEFNKVFLMASEFYNLDPSETQELTIFDDGDMYTIKYNIKDLDEGTLEITDVLVD